jgi:beta-mannosidase
MHALSQIVEREDPGTRFTPTSPSGPAFSFDLKHKGQVLPEDAHGPWNWGGDMNSWRELWQANDSLLRSEFGFPAASPMDILEKFHGDCAIWPPTPDNPYWMHGAAWWLQFDRFKDQLKGLPPEQAIAKYVELSLALQAEALAIAAEASKSRFPRCGGMLIWMGHDCFPCPANTSIIDFLGRPKPAYKALAKIFQADK